MEKALANNQVTSGASWKCSENCSCNIAIMWREELPEDLDEDVEDIKPGNPDIAIEDNEDSASRRNADNVA